MADDTVAQQSGDSSGSTSDAAADQADVLDEPADALEPTAPRRTAVIIPLHEDINPLSGALLKRKFTEAVDSGVDVIILDIHSPGGHTHVTFEMMDMILDAKGVETVAYIEKDAISGAALIALACDKIIMLPGARFGDAGEIVMGADGAFRYTEAKSRSVVAQKARDTAEATGRPRALAEKMSDKDMVVFQATHKTDGRTAYFSEKEWAAMQNTDDWQRGRPIREAGKEMFFTVNGRRAVELGMANGTIETRGELADALNVQSPIPIKERTWVDTLIFILNSGFVTFLLLFIGMIALVIELGAPGVGVGGLLAILCFGLFFWSRFLGGTAGWLEVMLFAIGLAFIAMEIFVIPGFGVAGVSGLALTLGSLVMASRRVLLPATGEELTSLGIDVFTVLGAFLGFLIALIFLANYIGEIPGLSRLTLKPQLAAAGSGASVDRDSQALLPGWQRVEVGDVGETISPLRPSGKMQVDDHMVDVVTEGDFVDPGVQVKVIGKQGARVVVRPV
ncbi:MAG: peptidase [Pirellulaceae bacterium]|nr:peptidase [Pirellulaceae bacterium]